MKKLFYHSEIPLFVIELCETPPMQRLKEVGMNCGCEYTAFPRFQETGDYSRYEHSLGAGLIVWHFTQNKIQTAAALLHDIAAPCFAHTIDFLNGDYLRQESTEAKTEFFIKSSAELCEVLRKYAIPVDAVTDYHQYPIADNDSPRLSSDRLEYTLGNAVRYKVCLAEEAESLYGNICVGRSEEKCEELVFRNEEKAVRFAEIALACSEIYVSEEDRYSMQRLSEIAALALEKGILSEKELYSTEKRVIACFESDSEVNKNWQKFRALHKMVQDESVPEELRRVIFAKKRYIDPFVKEQGRVSEINRRFAENLDAYLKKPQTEWLYAE